MGFIRFIQRVDCTYPMHFGENMTQKEKDEILKQFLKKLETPEILAVFKRMANR